MLYLPIKKTWIISRVARRVYFVCALAAFSFFGVLVASVTAFRASGHATREGIAIAGFIFRLLLWPGLIGTALLSVAMWYFWVGFDNSGWLKKAIWFVPLYFLLPFGPAFYYFFVYCHNDEVVSCP